MNRHNHHSLREIASSSSVKAERIQNFSRRANVETRSDAAGPAVGPPASLPACGWFLFSQLLSLRRILNACRNAAEEFARLLRFSDRIGTTASAAMRTNATLSLRTPSVGEPMRGQTLRNTDLCQLGQTQISFKRYKTGMFANLAMLANVFQKLRGRLAHFQLSCDSCPQTGSIHLFSLNRQ